MARKTWHIYFLTPHRNSLLVPAQKGSRGPPLHQRSKCSQLTVWPHVVNGIEDMTIAEGNHLLWLC